MTALAGFGTLANLDLDQFRRVDQQGRRSKASAGDLLAAVLGVLAVHVRNLAALAIDAQHVGACGSLRVGAERHLVLRAEAHRADDERQGVLTHAAVDLRGLETLVLWGQLQPHRMAQRHRLIAFEVPQDLGVLCVPLFGTRETRECLPDLGIHAR